MAPSLPTNNTYALLATSSTTLAHKSPSWMTWPRSYMHGKMQAMSLWWQQISMRISNQIPYTTSLTNLGSKKSFPLFMAQASLPPTTAVASLLMVSLPLLVWFTNVEQVTLTLVRESLVIIGPAGWTYSWPSQLSTRGFSGESPSSSSSMLQPQSFFMIQLSSPTKTCWTKYFLSHYFPITVHIWPKHHKT